MSLERSPPHIQLAVDLIQLLEENKIDPQVVLDALEIIGRDYKVKLSTLAKNEIKRG